MKNLVDDHLSVPQDTVTRRAPGHDTLFTMLLFASVGAIAWAIRGTAGWGGVDGTLVPGLAWGWLWWFFWNRQGVDARHVALWLGLGIALGGELGYGQYTGWIQSLFSLGTETIPISPVTGYIWFFICGLGWAAPGGIVLGWALGGNGTTGRWLVRSLWMIVLLLILFAWPLVDKLAIWLAQTWPGLLFPHADMGIYAGQLGPHLSRTIYTNTQNALVAVWLTGALLIAVLQKDRITLLTGLILSVGFGVGFMISAAWCLGYGFAPQYIDWWKMWELNAGFFLGLLYALVMIWAGRQQVGDSGTGFRFTPPEKAQSSRPPIALQTIFLALSGSLLIFAAGFEYFFWTGIGLTLFYFLSMTAPLLGKCRKDGAERITKCQKEIMLVYSWFLLWFILFHGGSEQAGILLGLYSEQAVDQYAWPAERILLFAPIAILLVAAAGVRIWKILQRESVLSKFSSDSRTDKRLYSLLGGLLFIGVLSIWPAKISVFYGLFLWLALFSSQRLYQKS